MGGRDKGLLPLAGRPLIAHVLERLRPQVDAICISANRHADEYAAFGHPVLADALPGYAGPLAGIHAGLSACATPLLAVVPCDAPRLPADLVAALHAGMAAAGAPAALVAAGGELQPTFMLCRRETLADLTAFLDGGGRGIRDWLHRLGAAEIPRSDVDAYVNINTPEELAAAGR